jgi:hypothetical protein
VIFGVAIDTWHTYTVLICYQITRAVISSLLENVYMPFMSKVAALNDCKEEDYQITDRGITFIQIGKALTTVSSTWSSFSNFVLTFTQVDLAVVALLVNVLTDAVYLDRALRAKMQRSNCSTYTHVRAPKVLAPKLFSLMR